MARSRYSRTVRLLGAAAVVAATVGVAQAAPVSAGAAPERRAHCSQGALTLSHYGDHVYPETGNGGYRSVHTGVHLVYDAPTNRFLDGTHVDLLDVATQCLTAFSLDFERHSVDTVAGPDLSVRSITVNGRPASYRFVQPTYPGDPHGPDDPDPRAHEASQNTPVGGPAHNPLPPACSPQLTGNDPDAQDGQQCPATKLVVTPAHPVRAGQPFLVSVRYIGRPGTHLDGDGSTEGWFRNNTPQGDGSLVTTEPVGTEDWMPLNDHPSAKPRYDFWETVNAGRTALANGVLRWTRHHPASAQFPGGSTTWRWSSEAPVASYLVTSTIGTFDFSVRHVDGKPFYEAQSSALSAATKKADLAVMDLQPSIVAFQSHFNGPFPFRSDGVVVGIPDAGFEEEMQTMIMFCCGEIDLDTLHHENMHQWWGDNVTESNYDMTFFKEGLATLGEYFFAASTASGGADAGAAFDRSLVTQFDANYAATGRLWAGVPSDPTPYSLFSGSDTYTRPGTAYLALRQILGPQRFDRTLQWIQRRYGGATIDEPHLLAAFARPLPRSCRGRLAEFFTQWFDTRYPTASGATKPTLTGPGLAGKGFYDANGSCRSSS